jgi:hypothetical protein
VQSLRQVGGALGVAGLGNVLATAYGRRIRVDGLPSAAADAARESVGGAASIAARLGDGPLLRSAQVAYSAAMDQVLIVCAVGAGAGAVLIWLFLSGGPAGRPHTNDHAGESEYDHTAS